jgi:uncharacterized repeat protein (TIGR02543 family)
VPLFKQRDIEYFDGGNWRWGPMRARVKRAAAAAVAAVVLFSLTGLTPSARADTMTTSEDGIAFLKKYEGFRSHVYWDSGNAFIGYGTICKSTDYPAGISQETGDALLRQALAVKENTVNQFLVKYNIRLTQNQYDAVLDLTYNIGSAWMSPSYRLYNILKNGIINASASDIVNAIGTWCHQGKSVVDKLVERRIGEAKIFLYNDYTGNGGHDYKYLLLDAGDGDVDNSIEFFECGKPYGDIQTPVRAGYTFAGWYTKDGVPITATTVVSQDYAVAASWVSGTASVTSCLFSDVTTADWFYKYVTDLGAEQILKGYPDGAFHPADAVSCGEALKLILLAVGFPQQTATGDNWASGYLTLALSKGIVADGEITDLNAAISRQMIAGFAARALGLEPIETQEATFADTSDGFVLALYYVNIITGSTGPGGLMFHPQAGITRAELSAIVWRISNSGIVQG